MIPHINSFDKRQKSFFFANGYIFNTQKFRIQKQMQNKIPNQNIE